MRTVAEYRARREEARKNIKVHLGHLPIGTVVEVEDPTLSFEPGTDHYKRRTSVVAGLQKNGIDSYVFNMLDYCELSQSVNSINISWIRKIVSRGTGKLSAEDQATLESLKERRRVYMATHHPKWHDEPKETLQNTGEACNGNRYKISYFPMFLSLYLKERGLVTELGEHLYDMDWVNNYVYENITKRYLVLPYSKKTDWCLGSRDFTVSKKQFAKVVKQALAKGKRSRHIAVAIEYAEEMERMEREWAHDYDNGDL